MQTSDVIATVSLAATIVGTVVSAVLAWRATRDAASAEIAAKYARDQADTALTIAAQAKALFEAAHVREEQRDELEAARREAPGHLARWIHLALHNGPDARARGARTYRWTVEKLEAQAELIAAQTATQSDQVEKIDPPVPVLGGRVTIFVKGPSTRVVR